MASGAEGVAVTERPMPQVAGMVPPPASHGPGSAPRRDGAPAPAPDDAGLSADPIRVLIADDHALFRRGLEMVLEEEDGIELVGQASDGAEAVQMATETVPDVILMDIRMPKTTG